MADLKADFLVPAFTDDKYEMPEPVGKDNVIAKVAPTAIYLCIIGLTESLMTLQKIDTMLQESTPGKGRQEVLAQGLANV